MILKVTTLSKYFNLSPIFRDFSLTVYSGEKIGLNGPNGSGKTTLLKMISGITSIDSGEIQINGLEVNPEQTNSRKNVFYLGHSVGLYPGLTGQENLEFMAGLYSQSTSTIPDILSKVGLGTNESKLLKFYSQGMRQRLKLASALVIDPNVLLLDEPLTGLDPDGIQLFETILSNWDSRGKTMVIVSHNLDWLSRITDRIITLA
ncbi:MAG: heme ABC exporter ATP-binding protein CcmA [Candidatus Marinimicrobia bacterium]|nr:heme ABC exporter ATP-binding protein CcmA [Candidatus Neomarinimicrobiota bacterium]MBT4155335.1 heme ABC exporter ATP-binding protein CcmA [Candidatus Neomarinimicrobiota bacterium]MBT4752571.1 heme ABC exporter ATP-binding protein CcmA [Candidatus Neomarinimicrobiota bacterium]MBT5114664.1 heme ABC exporter ATP-binding protein CcmA [Candidatus Neomarinimicrobiota bacterium]MBT5748210.1 heme ABC exporter ATP-binding protein CcmA [Candidatus Neomarinimicrobiota bacterium]